MRDERKAEGLLYRWFVEFNPLYLLSAMLVLGGMILLSRGLAHEGSLYGQLGVAAIAEVYAIALIGAAAILMRIGQRRSAVMLALLTAIYQCDLTLHTEACPNLGPAGVFASGAWLGLFVAKLMLLARALRVKISGWAMATAALGAAGLAILPFCLSYLGPRPATALVTIWLFSLSLLHRSGAVTNLGELDAWGQTVQRRTTRAIWLSWTLLLALHVLFWCTQYHLSVATMAALVPLVLVRFIRSEAQVWCAVIGTLFLVALAQPVSFSLAAFVAAAALALRAWSARSAPPREVTKAPVMAPYRAVAPAEPVEGVTSGAAGTDAVRRLFAGSVLALYVSLWTAGWSGGPWPTHIVGLDVALTAAVFAGVWRLHVRSAVAPLAITWGHFALQARVVTAPQSMLGWGGTAIGLGFVLLLGSVAASYWLRPRVATPRSGR